MTGRRPPKAGGGGDRKAPRAKAPAGKAPAGKAPAAKAPAAKAPAAKAPAARAQEGAGGLTVQRTLNVPAAAVIRAINDPDRRDWAPERLYRVVSVLAPRFIRIAFPDGSFAAISVMRQGNARCVVTVELSKLPAGADERTLRERWAYGLAAMQDQLDTAWD